MEYRKFIAAIRRGKYHEVKEMLQNNQVNPARSHNEPIRNAVLNGKMDIIELLLGDERVDPSDNDNEAIEDAARMGREDIVALLFQDPRVRDKGLPFPDPSSEDPLAQILGEILIDTMRTTHEIVHKHGFARNPRLAEYSLMSHIFGYHPVAQKRRK